MEVQAPSRVVVADDLPGTRGAPGSRSAAQPVTTAQVNIQGASCAAMQGCQCPGMSGEGMAWQRITCVRLKAEAWQAMDSKPMTRTENDFLAKRPCTRPGGRFSCPCARRPGRCAAQCTSSMRCLGRSRPSPGWQPRGAPGHVSGHRCRPGMPPTAAARQCSAGRLPPCTPAAPACLPDLPIAPRTTSLESCFMPTLGAQDTVGSM